MNAEHTPEPLTLDPDEALSRVPDIFGHCATTGEERRRMHIGDFALDAVDPTLSHETRTDAVRHMLGCDPVRALASVIELAAAALGSLEQFQGDPPGTAIAMLREDLAALRQGGAERERLIRDLGVPGGQQ